ncbi:aminopeptidase [Coemansia sp. RSA 2599]|nr:aminopeptidase [Coemansia sp. RSA 2599]
MTPALPRLAARTNIAAAAAGLRQRPKQLRLRVYRGNSQSQQPASQLHTTSIDNKGFLSTLLQTAKTKDPVTTHWHGQPTHEERPDLMRKNEVTPGITKAEYEARRQSLVSALPKGSTAFVFSSGVFFVSPHVFHGFRQHSDFYYLTGWNEPDSVAVIQQNSHASRGYTMTMFVNPKDPEKEVWEGPRNGLSAAVSVFGADEAWPIDEFTRRTADLVAQIAQKPADEGYVYADLDSQNNMWVSPQCKELKRLLKRDNLGPRIRRLSPSVQKLRLIKSDAEVALMREAGRVSGLAFAEIIRESAPGMSESMLQSVFEHACKMALVGKSTSDGGGGVAVDRSALTRPAYVPVFASGEHALCMHYVLNSASMRGGDLVLVDAGAEYASYASDITRTFPVNGRFADAQRDLYSAVLSVQQQMISLCNVDSGYSLNEIHRRSTQVMATELKQIGFHASSRDIDDRLYPHHISHYLGMDVHDTVDMSRSQLLKKNMVVTVEPGIYVPYDDRFPKAFQGMGIRIEDDIVVGQTVDGIQNLTALAPKTVEEIEACAEARQAN